MTRNSSISYTAKQKHKLRRTFNILIYFRSMADLSAKKEITLLRLEETDLGF